MYEKAKEMYLNGLSMMEIDRQIGFPRKKLSLLLKEEGLLRNFHDGSSLVFKEKYDKTEHLKIVDEYLNGKTMAKIAEENDMSDSKVGRIISYHNIKARDAPSFYKVNTNKFASVEDEETAYWLGFLYADGYISKGNTIIELCLSVKDEEHLVKFKDFIETTSPIKVKKINLNDKEYIAKRLSICNKKIADNLESLGCHNNKGSTLVFPDDSIVPPELLHHFMRGYFDGDGSVYKSKENQVYVSVIGNIQFITEYQNVLSSIGINKNKLRAQGKAFDMRFSGNKQYEKFKKYIYKDANIYLKRKIF